MRRLHSNVFYVCSLGFYACSLGVSDWRDTIRTRRVASWIICYVRGEIVFDTPFPLLTLQRQYQYYYYGTFVCIFSGWMIVYVCVCSRSVGIYGYTDETYRLLMWRNMTKRLRCGFSRGRTVHKCWQYYRWWCRCSFSTVGVRSMMKGSGYCRKYHVSGYLMMMKYWCKTSSMRLLERADLAQMLATVSTMMLLRFFNGWRTVADGMAMVMAW